MLEEDSGWMPDMLTILCIFLFVFVILYALRQWIKGAQFTEKISARGRVAIITGFLFERFVINFVVNLRSKFWNWNAIG